MPLRVANEMGTSCLEGTTWSSDDTQSDVHKVNLLAIDLKQRYVGLVTVSMIGTCIFVKHGQALAVLHVAYISLNIKKSDYDQNQMLGVYLSIKTNSLR